MSERDIVERVRKEVGGAQVLRFCYPKTALEACDEILRLRAELAARAVPDEEVANIILQGINAHYDDANSTAGMAESAIKALRAAGFTVLRTEARDGGE